MANVIGIDFGTSSSCVGIFQNGKVHIIKNDYGNCTTPMYVAFNGMECYVGEKAKNQILANPQNTIFGIHRLIGRKFHDTSFQYDMKNWPFKVVSSVDGDPKVEVKYKYNTKEFFPEEILARLIKYLKEIAEIFLHQSVADAVITVPAYYNFSQRQSIIDAAVLADLNILRLIIPSTAAAIAYGIYIIDTAEKNVLVFDFGGGTLNVSEVEILNGVYEVKSVFGCINIGGIDFDNRLINHFASEFKRKHHKDITLDSGALCRLRTACERAKRRLSYFAQTNIEIDSLFEGIDFYTTITRARFEELSADIFRDIIDCVEKVIRDAKINRNKIDEIILIGGSSKIPRIHKLLCEFFNDKSLNKSSNSNEAVVYGTSLFGALLSDHKSEVIEDFLLLDITPISFGIETAGGTMTPIVKRNATVPTKTSVILTTSIDNQENATIKVYQGESEMAKDNYLLDKFEFCGIPPAPQGAPRIEVIFELDVYDNLVVTAQDKLTGKQETVDIAGNNFFYELHTKNQKRNEPFSAKQKLERYCFYIKHCVENLNIIGKISEEDYKIVTEKCNKTLSYFYAFQNATEKEFHNLQASVEEIWNPIIVNLYNSVSPKKPNLKLFFNRT